MVVNNSNLFRQLSFWLRIFRLHRWVIPGRQIRVSRVPARSDACAEPHMVRIGGWWAPSTALSSDLDQSRMRWFSTPVDVSRLPFASELSLEVLLEPQRLISMLELLALLVLLRERSGECCDQVITLPVSQETDSMVAKHITKKWYTSADSIAPVIQELAFHCSSQRVELHVGHVPGVINQWADDASRDVLHSFNPALRVWPKIYKPEFWSTWSLPPQGDTPRVRAGVGHLGRRLHQPAILSAA